MIFIANVLSMNGGTTFLTRICRRLDTLGKRPAVLVMFDDIDPELLAEISQHAHVFYLWHYVPHLGRMLPSRLRTFGPIDWQRLCSDLDVHAGHIHVMGVFGLLFACRLHGRFSRTPTLTVGVYHQNEYLYEARRRHFPWAAQRIFRAVPSRNVVFFNGSTKQNYERFFEKDYSEAAVIPIGIDIPAQMIQRSTLPMRIVSVGNLVEFKTYNEHMIRVVAAIRGQFPDISYHIYGAGTTRERLDRLIRELDLEQNVVIKGAMPYSDFDRIVSEAALFVGSGTALVEAAALGVPALIGIESVETPVTYGFLCDVPGLSYNEMVADFPTKEIRGCVEMVLKDSLLAEVIGDRCRSKAQEFSIDITVDGLMNISDTSYQPRRFKFVELTLFSLMLVVTAVSDKIWRGNAFSHRRNQSYAAQ